MQRNSRTALQGEVIGVKMNKTIVVLVSTKRNAKLYEKRVGYSKKYYAHDEKNEAGLGDVVSIMACRPISKLKRWRLVSIDEKAIGGAKPEEVEASLEAKEGSASIVKEAADKAEEEEA